MASFVNRMLLADRLSEELTIGLLEVIRRTIDCVGRREAT